MNNSNFKFDADTISTFCQQLYCLSKHKHVLYSILGKNICLHYSDIQVMFVNTKILT